MNRYFVASDGADMPTFHARLVPAVAEANRRLEHGHKSVVIENLRNGLKVAVEYPVEVETVQAGLHPAGEGKVN